MTLQRYRLRWCLTTCRCRADPSAVARHCASRSMGRYILCGDLAPSPRQVLALSDRLVLAYTARQCPERLNVISRETSFLLGKREISPASVRGRRIWKHGFGFTVLGGAVWLGCFLVCAVSQKGSGVWPGCVRMVVRKGEGLPDCPSTGARWMPRMRQLRVT